MLCSKGAFCCACSVTFILMWETAGMRLPSFPAQESRKKRRRKTRRKTIVGRVFETTFLVIFPSVTYKRQNLKIVVWCVEGSYFQKAKDCTNGLESCLVIVWVIAIYDVICEGRKGPVEEHKWIGLYTLIVSLLSQVMVDRLKYSLSCRRFFRASNVLLVKCTSNYSEKLKFTFTEVYVLF